MDAAFFPKYIPTHDIARIPQFEDYDDLLRDLEQSRDANHQPLYFPQFRPQNPTPASSVEDVRQQPTKQPRHHGRPSNPQVTDCFEMKSVATAPWKHEQVGMQSITPESQSEDALHQTYMQSTSQPNTTSALQYLAHTQGSQLQNLNNVFNANLEEAAAFIMPQQAIMGSGVAGTTASMSGSSQQPGTTKTSGMPGHTAFQMPTLNSPVHYGFSDERFRVSQNGQMGLSGAGFDVLQQTAASAPRDQLLQYNDETFGRSDQFRLAQPMAVRGTASANVTNVRDLHVQAEQLAGRPQRVSPVDSHSPAGSESSRDTFSDTMIRLHPPTLNQTCQRSSTTAEPSQNTIHVPLQPTSSPETRAQARAVFKKPTLPMGGTLAERRKQQLPDGLNVQRPKGLNIGRAFSSSAVTSLPPSLRYPTSPLATSRRNKSSVTGGSGVISGRVQKSGASSARNSPMFSSFLESAAARSLQDTPQPESTPTPQVHNTAPVNSSSPHAPDSYSDQYVHPTIDTPLFTPGMQTGSSMMQSQSWLGTPSMTPYVLQQPPNGKSSWPSASDMPQSAPAHILHFGGDLSPPHQVPSMPATPENMHLYQHAPQTQILHDSMGVSEMAGIPSQYAPTENVELLQAQQYYFGAGQFPMSTHQFYTGGAMITNDVYEQHPFYMMQQASPAAPRPIEVKLDAGCQKLSQEVSSGKARLMPLVPSSSEIQFHNITVSQMRENLRGREGSSD